MTIIYGVDTTKPVHPEDVRDALVECFTHAHSEALKELWDYSPDLTLEQFESIKRINVRQMIRQFFHDVHGDYDKPTITSIQAVMQKLMDFATNFRKPDIISRHADEMRELLKYCSEK